MAMKLEYVDAKGNRTYVGDASRVDEACAIITDWCRNSCFRSYYIRCAEFSDHYWFDFGSHTCFFELVKNKAKIV